MALEDIEGAGKYLDDLNSSNPVGSTDTKSTLDNHIRGVKNCIKLSFPNVDAPVTPTPAEFNKLDGLTASQAELNKLDGVTSSTAELNKLDGVGTVMDAGAAVVKTAGDMTFNDNIRIEFGTSAAESAIYSNGTNTYWNSFSDKDILFLDDGTLRFTFDISAGTLIATGNLTAYSDLKLKEDLQRIKDPIDKIQGLVGYTYTRKDTGERQTGLIAQDVQAVLPEVVVENNDILSLAYGNMMGLMVEGIKDLKKEITELRQQLNELQSLENSNDSSS